MDWDGGWIGKVPGIWIGFVVSSCSKSDLKQSLEGLISKILSI
jgi:hypothetical protein